MLERQPHQSLTIETSDGVITVMVTGVRGSYVTLGIDAPRECAIRRDDLNNKAPSQRELSASQSEPRRRGQGEV